MKSLRPHHRVLVFFAVSIVLSAGGASGSGDDSPPAGWLSTVQEQIAAQEYEITWQDETYLPDVDAAWQAPNRAHGFRTYFAPKGVRLIPRTSTDATWEWGLKLVGYGRGGRVRAVPQATLHADDNRIDYDRGGILEWYVNSPDGLEQGFTLSGPPEEHDLEGTDPARDTVAPAGPRSSPVAGAEADRVAYVELALEGTLDPTFSADGQAIEFRTGPGVNVVRFSKLKVTDATGSELAAWMEGASCSGARAIRIAFSDEGAVYPVIIDPLAYSPSWMAEANQDEAWFGGAILTAGDVNGDGFSDVIIGAEGYDHGLANAGAAFVFHGTPNGLEPNYEWVETGGQLNAAFGVSVGTAGDVNGDGYSDVVIGARLFDNDQSDEGRTFVYHGSADGLESSPAWTAESDWTGSSFGSSVSTAGDVNGDGYADVIVGAPYYPAGGFVEAGRAYVYHGSPQGIESIAAWTAESGQASAWLGWSVATAGDVNGDGYADVIIGAPHYGDEQYQGQEGNAFVFHGSASGLDGGGTRTVGRPHNADWSAESNQALANFGISVGTAGDVNGDGYADVIVGAPYYDDIYPNEGRAYVFCGSPSGLEATEAWTADSNQDNARFGDSVGTAGDVNGDGYADVIVGAPTYDDEVVDEGGAFVYLGGDEGLGPVAFWSAGSNQRDASYGHAVGTAGDVNGDGYSDVLVGAYAYDHNQTNEGRAYAYHGSAAGLATNAGWTAESDQSGALLGASAGTAGDVNGDGYADVIVGAQQYDGGEEDEGRVYVYHGSAAGLAASAAWMAERNQPGAEFGSSVGTAGDVNGDGYADVIAGAHLYNDGEEDEGGVWVYHGSAAGLETTAAWSAESNQFGLFFGEHVGTAGDVNGDGHADVVVGAARYDADRGRAYLYHGSASGLDLGGIRPFGTLDNADWAAGSDQVGAAYGFAVGTAGDVNGDGFADLAVGAPGYDGSDTGQGVVYVYHGSREGLADVAAWHVEGDQYDSLGFYLGTAGDVNGDGFADLIVAAPFYDGPFFHAEGRVYVYLGSTTGLAADAAWSASGDQYAAQLGVVGTAGDVNGDGFADVIVGSPFYDGGEAYEGRAYVYHGSSSGLATNPAWTAESDQVSADFGESVGTAGDVNGDGYADVVVGADRFDGDETTEDNEGRVYVFYGNRGAGLSVRPQQRRADDSAPVADGGRALEGDFRIAALGRTPFGRSRVMLEWEIKTRGIAFDGVPTGRSDRWFDTGTDGAALNELVLGLGQGGYHWRVRVLYDPATTPFQQAGRWFTVPWNGWNETDLAVGCLTEICNGIDDDCDGLIDEDESGQTGDLDGDGLSGLCDACPYDFDNDIDGDGVCGDVDNCPTMWNAPQLDPDGDGLGNICDPCPDDPETADDVCGAADVCHGFDDRVDCNGNDTPDGCDVLGQPFEDEAKPWLRDLEDDDRFGSSVSIQGDTMVIGSWGDDDRGQRSGSAHVYKYDPVVHMWIDEAKLTADDGAPYDYFGGHVAVHGEAIAIAANGDDDQGSASGSVYMYRFDQEGSLDWEQTLRASDGQAGDWFGEDLALDGNTLVVGAFWEDGENDLKDKSGAAYVFRYDSTKQEGQRWIEEQKLTAIDGAAGDNFGASVSIDGDTIVVGADLDDDQGDDSGSVYVYYYDRTTPGQERWVHAQKLTAGQDGAAGDSFGEDVAIHGDRIVVGADLDDDQGDDSGSVYVHYYDRTTPGQERWVLEEKLADPDGAAGDGFGEAVSINGETIVVGARLDDDQGSDAGSVFVFLHNVVSGRWVAWERLTAFDTIGTVDDHFGSDVAVSGDVIVVGAPFAKAIAVLSEPDSGAAYVFERAGLLDDCDRKGVPDECEPDTDTDGLIDACDPDDDGDAVSDAEDCAPLDADVYPGAPEINDGKDNQCPGDDGHGLADEISGLTGYGTPGDDDTFCWPAQVGATRYQIVRSADDPSFVSDCSVAEEAGTCHTDTEDPPPGSVFYYLVRALEPNSGSWGTDGDGDERNFACGAVGTSPENMASAHDRIVNDATVGVVGNAGPGSPNRLLYLDGEIPGPPPGNWGLDRSNQQTLPLDNNGSVSGTGGGVHVYVLDSGIHMTHQEFTGRADCFFDWEQGNDCADGNGHGTWVASLVAGETYGWANDAMVHAVRVLNNIGVGSEENIKAGLDAIAAGGEIPGVVVYPLRSGASVEIDAAVRRVIDAGFYVVAQANNDDADACNGSPARVPEILTVGATDQNDTRSSFSNWGSCVDLFAPGGDITGAWHTSDTATSTMSGTEAAAAFVAGAVAIHAERGNLLANDPDTGGTP